MLLLHTATRAFSLCVLDTSTHIYRVLLLPTLDLNCFSGNVTGQPISAYDIMHTVIYEHPTDCPS